MRLTESHILNTTGPQIGSCSVHAQTLLISSATAIGSGTPEIQSTILHHGSSMAVLSCHLNHAVDIVTQVLIGLLIGTQRKVCARRIGLSGETLKHRHRTLSLFVRSTQNHVLRTIVTQLTAVVQAPTINQATVGNFAVLALGLGFLEDQHEAVTHNNLSHASQEPSRIGIIPHLSGNRNHD